MDEFSLDNRHKLAAPYWARPSIRLAHGASKGGSSKKAADDDEEDDDDDDEEDDDDEDEEDDNEEDDDGLDDLTDAELKERLRETQTQLSKASGSSAARRKQLRKVKAELEEARKPKAATTAKAKGAKDDEAETVDAEAITAAAKSEARTEANERIKKAEARGALRAAGVASARVGKAVGLLDLSDLDVDDDGEVDGLDDALDELRKEWPELFPKTRNRRRETVAGGKDADGKTSKSTKPMSATEMQVAAALGKPIRR